MPIIFFILLIFLQSCGVDAIDTGSQSSKLLSQSSYGLYNPLPSGEIAGYPEDTGLDILSDHKPAYAVAAGTLVYSEHGHTSWTSGNDTPNSVLMKLDQPIKLKTGHSVTHIYYTHLSQLAYSQTPISKEQRKILGGEPLGITGLGNNVAHLHIGFLLDNVTAQVDDGTFLTYTDIRSMLGPYKQGDKLPSY